MPFTLEDMTSEGAESTQTTDVMDSPEPVAESTESLNEGEETELDQPQATETESEVEEGEAPEYEPDFSYEIKGEKREFPEWMKGAVKSKEHEELLRDQFTKLDGFDGIKESRSKIETDFNTFKEQVNPALESLNTFNENLNKGDFNSAFQMAGIKDEHLVSHMFSNEDSIKKVEQKLSEYYQMQDSGPKAQEAYLNANKYTQENQKLNYELQSTQQQLQSIQRQSFDQTLGQAIDSNLDAVSKYEQTNGQGSFEKFARAVGDMEWKNGNQMQPNALVSHVVKMLGYSNTPNTQPNETVNNTVTQEQKKPAVLPNIGGASSVSKVGKVATSMDEFKNMMNSQSA